MGINLIRALLWDRWFLKSLRKKCFHTTMCFQWRGLGSILPRCYLGYPFVKLLGSTVDNKRRLSLGKQLTDKDPINDIQPVMHCIIRERQDSGNRRVDRKQLLPNCQNKCNSIMPKPNNSEEGFRGHKYLVRKFQVAECMNKRT